MSDARERILADIRAALGRDALPEHTEETLEDLVADPPSHPAAAGEGTRLQRFIAGLEAAKASHERIDAWQDVGARLAVHAEGLGLQPPSWTLQGLSAKRLGLIGPAPETPAESAPSVLVTGALAGVAETGSVLIGAGEQAGGVLFLAEHHVVIIDESAVVDTLDDVWAQLRPMDRERPRAWHCITGASRTADIEQTLQIGAHGPRSLHVMIVAASERQAGG